GHVDGDEGHGTLRAHRFDLPGCQISRVGSFYQLHSCVGAKTACDLAVAGVHGNHLRGAALQHAVGKAAGRSAYIQAGAPREVNVPVIERRFQLQSPATHILQIFTQDANLGIRIEPRASLVHLLSVDQNSPSQQHGLRALPRGYDATLDQKLVNADLHRNFGSDRYLLERLSQSCTFPRMARSSNSQLNLNSATARG